MASTSYSTTLGTRWSVRSKAPATSRQGTFSTWGFFGALNVLRAALPVLRSQRSGHVLQMSSILGQMSFPATGILAAVKQALGGATQAMSAELAPLGIKFTQIEPGGLNTHFLSRWVVAEHTIADYDQTAGATLTGLKDL